MSHFQQNIEQKFGIKLYKKIDKLKSNSNKIWNSNKIKKILTFLVHLNANFIKYKGKA